MTVTPLFRAYGRARDLYERLAIAVDLEYQGKHAEAGIEREIAEAWLRNTADALGYEATKKPDVITEIFEKLNAQALGPRLRKAGDIQIGDKINGWFMVGDVSHGPLENQVRFLSPDETAVAFFDIDELVKVEREVRS